jgi:hypothetical protein
MTEQRSYPSPAAFRRALTDRLKAKSAQSRWSLAQLQRQFAYDRFLERLYMIDRDWIVKGATALLARDLGVRGTIDIDIYRAREREVAETELRDAATHDLGDWFRFEVGPRRPVADGVVGTRLPVTAHIGATVWSQFHVDLLGLDLRMTGEPEDVPALAQLDMPDVEQHGYRAYPLVDHIADKVAAMFERYGDANMPSTRFKDLVDLVAIVTGASVSAQAQMAALASEADRRAVTLPDSFAVPDPDLWQSGYGAEANRSLLSMPRTLDDALATVLPFRPTSQRQRARSLGSPTPRLARRRIRGRSSSLTGHRRIGTRFVVGLPAVGAVQVSVTA